MSDRTKLNERKEFRYEGFVVTLSWETDGRKDSVRVVIRREQRFLGNDVSPDVACAAMQEGWSHGHTHRLDASNGLDGGGFWACAWVDGFTRGLSRGTSDLQEKLQDLLGLKGSGDRGNV